MNHKFVVFDRFTSKCRFSRQQKPASCVIFFRTKIRSAYFGFRFSLNVRPEVWHGGRSFRRLTRMLHGTSCRERKKNRHFLGFLLNSALWQANFHSSMDRKLRFLLEEEIGLISLRKVPLLATAVGDEVWPVCHGEVARWSLISYFMAHIVGTSPGCAIVSLFLPILLRSTRSNYLLETLKLPWERAPANFQCRREKEINRIT